MLTGEGMGLGIAELRGEGPLAEEEEEGKASARPDLMGAGDLGGEERHSNSSLSIISDNFCTGSNSAFLYSCCWRASASCSSLDSWMTCCILDTYCRTTSSL